MTIIKAHIEHLDLIVSLFDAYRVFYKRPSNKDAAKQFLFERLKNRDSIIFLALIENKAVGFTQLYTSFSSVSMQPIYILNDLYVTKEFRKQGVGVALLNKAKQLCRDNNYKGLSLQTETTNPAQHLYESLGWEKDPDLQYFWTNKELN
ncbi:MAG: GNAT family N-acetyltransferase [Flavobacteriaceae bacterium]|nr:GNAT family N-acetyltransferase [Flavobacteriaceae bacterium]